MSKSDLENVSSQEPSLKETDTNTSNEVEGAAPSGSGSANLEAIADELTSDMPEVQTHALEQERENEKARLDEFAGLVDRDGNPFDPSVHKVNKQGEPTLSTKGLLIKKPGRKTDKQRAQSTIGSSGGGGSVVGVEQARNEQQARATGAAAANMMFTAGIVIGGDEWQPMRDEKLGIDEKTMVESAFGDYFVATGKTDLPPNVALTVAICGYILPRFTMPKTQSRFARYGAGIKKWWANRKLKKHGLKAEPIKKEK